MGLGESTYEQNQKAEGIRAKVQREPVLIDARGCYLGIWEGLAILSGAK